MKALFLIKDSLTNKISYYHIMAMLAVLPFDQFYSHIIFGSFALHTLIHLKKEKLKDLLSLKVLILQAIFFVTLISCIYTSYPASAGTDVTRQLVILLFPIFFSLTSLNLHKYRDNLLFIFSLVCMCVIVYLYLHAFVVIHYFKLPLKTIFSNALISHNFSAPIGMHATFFSLQISVALLYMLSLLINGRAYKLFYLAAILLLFAGIVQLGSKAILIAVLISANLAVPYFLIARSKRIKYVLITGAVSALVIFASLSTGSFRERYLTDLKNDLSHTLPTETVEPRLVRWKAIVAVIEKSPVIGYGAGSELSLLHDTYYHQKLYISFLHWLNAHNQYLTFMLVSGIIGLLVYLITLFYGFKIAFRQRDLLFFVFLLLIVMVSLSESLLNAEKGIWFYSLFFSFFVFSYPSPGADKID